MGQMKVKKKILPTIERLNRCHNRSSLFANYHFNNHEIRKLLKVKFEIH